MNALLAPLSPPAIILLTAFPTVGTTVAKPLTAAIPPSQGPALGMKKGATFRAVNDIVESIPLSKLSESKGSHLFHAEPSSVKTSDHLTKSLPYPSLFFTISTKGSPVSSSLSSPL